MTIRTARLAVILVAGCSRSPDQDLFGSFFPAWMICALGGIVIAVILRQLLAATGINRYLLAPPLTYLSIAVGGTFLIWLLWLGG